MVIEIRTITPDEKGSFAATLEAAFGIEHDEGENERWQQSMELDRCFAAFDDDNMVATSGAFSFRMSVPGGEAPVAGVTMIGVLPTHRRRGILTKMMRRLTDQAHERGEPVAALWASEEVIYQRFGYGLATMHSWTSIERERARFRGDPEPLGRTRLMDMDEALKTCPGIYERVRRTTPGMMARSEDWWERHTLYDSPRQRQDGMLFRVLWENDGAGEAYAFYRSKNDWTDGVPSGTLTVGELVATSPVATREVWRFLFGVDLMKRVKGEFQRADHPLLLMLEEPRRLRAHFSDALWLRLVDVQQALAARSYATEGSITFEVSDSFCHWNNGCWRLDAGGGGAGVTAVPGGADIKLSAADLASAYLGTFTFAQLARAGRVEELTADALARADALFRTDIAPWCPEIF